MAPCDASTSSYSANSGIGMSGMMLRSSSPNATSAPSPPPCISTSSVSTVMIVVSIAGFVTIILATGLLVYIFRKLGWVHLTDPATVPPERAARLRALRESANVAKGLDPAVIRSFPVYTFREEKIDSRGVTPETTGLTSLRRISREISRTLSSSSRRISREFSISRCPTREENSSIGFGPEKESARETGSKRGEFVVNIEGDDNMKFPLSGDEEARSLPSGSPTLTWTNVRECAVCLGEYAAGERIKVVPACAHGFHADCIDLWLAAKTTCPICRTDLKPEAPLAPIPPIPPIT